MRRIIAALVGILLAVVGALLVMNYAKTADERAAAELSTQSVVVALEEIPAGTPVSEFGDRVEVRQIPGLAVIDGAISDVDDVESLVLAAPSIPGEQLTRSRLVTADELRARGETQLPEDLVDHHQVTLLLEKARALGGDIAPGDEVGVFMSFDVDSDGQPITEGDESSDDESETDSPVTAGSQQVSITDLTLHKVPVVRVEGAFVAPPLTAGDGDESEGSSEDRIFVTLALEAEEAARLVFAAEWGSVYLSREPEGASEDEVPTIVITLPDRGRDVLE